MVARRPALTPADVGIDADGRLRSHHYDDVYHPRAGGLGQAQHVFLAGNGLLGPQARWPRGGQFVILETGFGLGLNFLTTWQAWRAAGRPCRLHFVSVEQHPLPAETLAAQLATYPELADLADQLRAQWPPPVAGVHRLHFADGQLGLTLVFAAAHTALPTLTLSADALFLDGFAPARNLALWSPEVLRAATLLCKAHATLATWCVAGAVRRSLQQCGWQLSRRPGFASKREMLCGVLAPPADAMGALPRRSAAKGAVPPKVSLATPATPASPATTGVATRAQRALVIGAGLAGCSVAESLTRRGWQVHLIEATAQPASAASGNPAGILLPRLAHDDALAARLARAAFLYALRQLASLAAQPDSALRYAACGVLQLATDAAAETRARHLVERLALPPELLRYVDAASASARAGWPLKHGGWWFEQGAWVAPATLCQALLAQAGAALRCTFSTPVARIAQRGGDWLALAADGQVIDRAAHLIVATANSAAPLLPGHTLALESVRGQISIIPDGALPALRCVLCGPAYLTPAAATGSGDAPTPMCLGASFDRHDADPAVRATDHLHNLANLARMLADPATTTAMAHTTALASLTRTVTQFDAAADARAALGGRTAFRCMSHDKLPLVGTLADPLATQDTRSLATLTRTPGLHVFLGLGARGLLWAGLGAELLACRLNAEPLPLEQALAAALDPARFLLRALRRSAAAPLV